MNVICIYRYFVMFCSWIIFWSICWMYIYSMRCSLVSHWHWNLWSLPSGLLHSKTAVFWSISPPGDLSQCEPGQSNNPWVLQCFCLSPEWSASDDWSPSSALQHSQLPQSPWYWSACASPGRWEVSPCWMGRFVLCYRSCPGWKWNWKVRWWQFFMQQSPPFAAFHWWVQGEGVSPASPCWAAELSSRKRCTERPQIWRTESFVQFRLEQISMIYTYMSYFITSSFKLMIHMKTKGNNDFLFAL